MRRILQKLSCIILTIFMLFPVSLQTVSAAGAIDYTQTQTRYMESKNKGNTEFNIFINNVPAGKSISKSSVKVLSGKSAVSLSTLFKSKDSYYNKSFDKKPVTSSSEDESYLISGVAKKAGTGKISFKVGNKSYVSTVKVLPYTNPISSLTITGVNNGANLAGKFKTGNTGSSIRINKNAKNVFITCKAASGWNVVSINFFNKKTNNRHSIASTNGLNRSNGVSSLKAYVGNLLAKQEGTLSISLRNSKTGGYQSCTVDFK